MFPKKREARDRGVTCRAPKLKVNFFNSWYHQCLCIFIMEISTSISHCVIYIHLHVSINVHIPSFKPYKKLVVLLAVVGIGWCNEFFQSSLECYGLFKWVFNQPTKTCHLSFMRQVINLWFCSSCFRQLTRESARLEKEIPSNYVRFCPLGIFLSQIIDVNNKPRITVGYHVTDFLLVNILVPLKNEQQLDLHVRLHLHSCHKSCQFLQAWKTLTARLLLEHGTAMPTRRFE